MIFQNLIIILLLLTFSYSNNSSSSDNNTTHNTDALSFDFKRRPDHFYISTLNAHIEEWRVYRGDNKMVWKIESVSGGTYYKDVYFFKNNKILYILIENNGVENGEIYRTSNIQYYFENDKLFDCISLGMGPMEHDDWDPNAIYKIYNKRAAEYKVLLRKYIDFANK